MRLYVKDKFDAAHFLLEYNGKCKDIHGHTWVVEVWIDKQIKSGESMVIDFAVVKDIIIQFDHKLVNDYITNPTAENIVRYFLKAFKTINLKAKIRVWETENNCIEGTTDEDM